MHIRVKHGSFGNYSHLMTISGRERTDRLFPHAEMHLVVGSCFCAQLS